MPSDNDQDLNVDGKEQGSDNSGSADAEIMDRMIKHGLINGEGLGENDPGEGDGGGEGDPGKIEIGDKEFTTEEIKSLVEEHGSLKETVRQLSEGDAKVGRELTEKLTAFLEQASKPSEDTAPSSEDVNALKQQYDEQAAEDYTGTTLELAAAVAERKMKPLLDKIEKLEKKISSYDEERENLNKASAQQKKAMGNINEAFKSANMKVDVQTWDKMSKWAGDFFGIDLNSVAYNSPESLKKITSTYSKLVSKGGNGDGGGGKPRLGGLPAGGGGEGGQSELTDEEKTQKRLEKFGLIK